MCTVKELKMLLEGIDDDTVVCVAIAVSHYDVIYDYDSVEINYLPVDKFCHVPDDNSQGLVPENHIYFVSNGVGE